MTDYIWSLEQEGRIAEAKTAAADAKNEVSRYKDRIQDLEFSVNRLALASQALWELLRSRLGVSDAELLAKMSEIDLRDGVKDQRITTRIASCPRCGRTVNTKSARCLYCGAALAKPNVFQ